MKEGLVEINALGSGVCEIIMNDLDTGNAETPNMMFSIRNALEKVASEVDSKVVILTGANGIFSSGGSAKFFRALDTKDIGPNLFGDPTLLRQCIEFSLPIVCALNGHAVGGGLMMALFLGDLHVASESSRYGANFTDLGFTPGVGATGLLPQLAGDSFANEMLLTGKLYLGSELRDRKLFSHVVPMGDVASQSLEIARRIAEKPRSTLELLRRTFTSKRRHYFDGSLFMENLMHRVSFYTNQNLKQEILERLDRNC